MRFAFRVWLVLIVVLVQAGALAAQPGPAPSLAAQLQASRWQQRVLLLYAPTPSNAALRRQRQLLAAARSGLAARDVLVRELIGSELSGADACYLARQLGVAPGRFAAVLLGKDGGVKRRATQPLLPAELFAVIDAMPMRRQEMRRRP